MLQHGRWNLLILTLDFPTNTNAKGAEPPVLTMTNWNNTKIFQTPTRQRNHSIFLPRLVSAHLNKWSIHLLPGPTNCYTCSYKDPFQFFVAAGYIIQDSNGSILSSLAPLAEETSCCLHGLTHAGKQLPITRIRSRLWSWFLKLLKILL